MPENEARLVIQNPEGKPPYVKDMKTGEGWSLNPAYSHAMFLRHINELHEKVERLEAACKELARGVKEHVHPCGF